MKKNLTWEVTVFLHKRLAIVTSGVDKNETSLKNGTKMAAQHTGKREGSLNKFTEQQKCCEKCCKIAKSGVESVARRMSGTKAMCCKDVWNQHLLFW